MTFSIIILTHNNLNVTKKCLEYLYGFTKNFNLIIIDNASNDGTVEYLQQLSKNYNNIIIEYNANNMGIVRSRNRGYNIAKNSYPYPTYIGFIDNDQYCCEGWWNSYMTLFEKGYNVIGCEAWKMKKNFYPEKKIKDKNEQFSYVGAGGLFLHKEVTQIIPTIFDNQYYQFFEDPDLIFNIFYNTSFRAGWNYNPVIIHNHQGPLLTRKTRQYFFDSWKKFQKKWSNYPIPVFKMN